MRRRVRYVTNSLCVENTQRRALTLILKAWNSDYNLNVTNLMIGNKWIPLEEEERTRRKAAFIYKSKEDLIVIPT